MITLNTLSLEKEEIQTFRMESLFFPPYAHNLFIKNLGESELGSVLLLTGVMVTSGEGPRGRFSSCWACSWMLAPPSEALRPRGPIPFSSWRGGGCNKDCSCREWSGKDRWMRHGERRRGKEVLSSTDVKEPWL